MDLTDEQKEALASVQSAFSGPEQFADALNGEAQSYFKEVWQRGHSTATGQKKDKIEELEGQLQTAQETIEAKDQELSTLRKEQPDVDNLRKKWKEKELDPVAEERDKWKGKYRESETSRKLSRLTQAVADKASDEYVAKLHVQQQMDGRVKVDDEGQTYFLNENGERYYVPDGQDVVEHVASDLVQQLPEPYRADKAQGTKHSTDADRSMKKNGEASQVTRRDLASDPQAMADFIGQYETRQEGIEALQNLPEK